MDSSSLGLVVSVGGGAFLCGVAIMYVVMSRTWKKRDAERAERANVPTVIHLMMATPDQLWGDPCYPVFE